MRWVRRVVVERIARRDESVGREGGIMMMMWDVCDRGGRQADLGFSCSAYAACMQTLFSRSHHISDMIFFLYISYLVHERG